MQTVQFQCGHCGSMMGVSHEFLGQQVRCPTCQQVVVAPASSAPSAPEPRDSDADALFMANLQSAPIGHSQQPESQPALTHTAPTPQPESHFHAPEAPDSSLPWNDPAAQASDPGNPVARAQRQAASGGISWLWLLPLLSYSILSTVVAILFYIKLLNVAAASRNKELELMPDLNGDAPLKKDLQFNPKKERTTLELPDNWKTKLGEPVRIGSVEITPLRVEKKIVSVMREGGGKARPCRHESLVLHLEIKNLSDKFAFVPLDNYFDRKVAKDALPTFTFLQLGPENRYFGGPAQWYPIDGENKRKREWVAGRKNIDNIGLEPGETLETIVCTDGDDDELAERLQEYEGNLSWRVHVRCGPVPFENKLVAATAVVGVNFNSRDYRGEN